MAQIILKKSSVAARVPTITDLAFGELALNYADGLLYYKKSDNTIASISGGSGLTTTTNRAMLVSDGAGGVAESTNIFNIATNSSIDYLQLGDSTTGVSINGKGSPGYVGAPFLYTSNDDGSGYTHGTAAIMFAPNSTEITFGDMFSAYTGYSAAQQTISFNTSSHGVVGIFRDGNLHIGNNANYQISNRPGNIFLEQDKRISFVGAISNIDTNTAVWNNVDSYINPYMGATSFRGNNGTFEWFTAPQISTPSGIRPITLTRVMTLDTDGNLQLNKGSYTVLDNGSGAGQKVSIKGATGTGAAGPSGGNGFIELLGAGSTSNWTDFTGNNKNRRGGIYLQAGTAQGDSGNSYVNGSIIQILGANGTSNGTNTGTGSPILIAGGNVTRADTTNSYGASINLSAATSVFAGGVTIAGGGGNTMDFAYNGGGITISPISYQSGYLSGGGVTISGGSYINYNTGESTGTGVSLVCGMSGTSMNLDPNGEVYFTTGSTQKLQFGPLGQIGFSGPSYGDAGQVLTSGGADAAPTWTTVSTSSGTAGTNAGIAISSNVFSTVYNSTISDSLTVPVAVGGITAGTTAATLKAKNIVSILDDLLFPTVLPTYTVPTIATFTATQTGVKEIGSTISQNLAQTQNKNDAGAYSELVFKCNGTIIATTNPTAATIADIASQFGYADPNNPNKSYTQSYIDSYQVVSGTTTWTAEGTYAAGLAKRNNKGVTDTTTPAVRSTSAPQAASTLVSSSQTVTGIYPYYWGVSDTQPTAADIASAIAAGTANKVLADATSSIAIAFNASNQYIWFATAASYADKTKWTGTNNLSNTGGIYGTSGGSSTDFMSKISSNQSVSAPSNLWTTTFKVYVSRITTTATYSHTFS